MAVTRAKYRADNRNSPDVDISDFVDIRQYQIDEKQNLIVRSELLLRRDYQQLFLVFLCENAITYGLGERLRTEQLPTAGTDSGSEFKKLEQLIIILGSTRSLASLFGSLKARIGITFDPYFRVLYNNGEINLTFPGSQIVHENNL